MATSYIRVAEFICPLHPGSGVQCLLHPGIAEFICLLHSGDINHAVPDVTALTLLHYAQLDPGDSIPYSALFRI